MDFRANFSPPTPPHFRQFFWDWPIPSDLCLYSFSVAISKSKALCSSIGGPAACIFGYLTSLTPCTHIQELREMVPPPSQNTVKVCKQINLLVLYYISCRVVLCHRCPYTSLWYFDLSVSFKFINFSFQICLHFIPDLSTSFTSYIV